jgi:hypothetical protein
VWPDSRIRPHGVFEEVPVRYSVPAFVILAALAAGLALAAPGGGPAAAQTDSPTPTATPYPPASSTITVNFVQDDEPIVVTLATKFLHIDADGERCVIFVSTAVVVTSTVTWMWPLDEVGGQAPECMQGPPTDIRVEWLVLGPDLVPVGTFTAEFTWDGNDLIHEQEVPSELTDFATSTPSVTATPVPAAPGMPPVPTQTAAQLPAGGGPPPTTGSGAIPWAVLSAVIIFATGGALVWRRRWG